MAKCNHEKVTIDLTKLGYHRVYPSLIMNDVKPLRLPDDFEPFMVRWQRQLDERRQQKEESIWDD